MLTKKDYLTGALVGFLTAVFAVPVLWNLGIREPLVLSGLILLAPAFSFGVWLGGFLSRWFAFFAQFGKFAAVGFFNAAIDFGVLNFLMFVTGLVVGVPFSIFKGVSFVVATTNSYFWNRFWTFKAAGEARAGEYAEFLLVSLVGLGVNVGAASLVVNLIGPQFGLGPTVWANLGAAAGSAAGLVWNFVGYKFIVFRTPERAG